MLTLHTTLMIDLSTLYRRFEGSESRRVRVGVVFTRFNGKIFVIVCLLTCAASYTHTY
jgi:hypothetical protein